MMKTQGQIAYEADVMASPLYADGTARAGWDQIGHIAQETWEREREFAETHFDLFDLFDN